VVRRRCAGRPARRGATPDPLFSTKQENTVISKKNSAEPPMHGEVPKTCKKSSARWPATTQTSTSTHLTPQAYITTIYFNYEAIKPPPPPTLHPPPSPLPPQPHPHFHLHKHLHLLHHNHTTTSTTITTITQHNTTQHNTRLHYYEKEKKEKRECT